MHGSAACQLPSICVDVGKLPIDRLRFALTEPGGWFIWAGGERTLMADNCRPAVLTVHELVCLAQHANGCKVTPPDQLYCSPSDYIVSSQVRGRLN